MFRYRVSVIKPGRGSSQVISASTIEAAEDNGQEPGQTGHAHRAGATA